MATIVKAPVRAGKTPAWDRPVRLTALHREHLAHGATLVERDGWLLPGSYGNAAAEATALREGVGVLDIGESGKIDLKSDDLDAALAAAFPGLGRVAVGAVVEPSPSTGARNTPLPDGGRGESATRVLRLTDWQALLITAPAALQSTLEAVGKAVASLDCTHVTDLTSALCGVWLLGHKAPAVLERLSSVDLAPDRFPDGALAQAAVARAHAIVARRDAAGATGYDIYVDRDLGSYLWDCLMEQGAPLGIKPVGRDVAISTQ